jgi:hypothetical protein
MRSASYKLQTLVILLLLAGFIVSVVLQFLHGENKPQVIIKKLEGEEQREGRTQKNEDETGR